MKRFHIPKLLILIAMEMIWECFSIELLKKCYRLYWNFYFLVAKENSKHQLINAAVFLNKVLVKNANLLSSVDEFLEKFSGMAVISVVDLYSDYNQILLALESRDRIAFQTLVRLLQITTLPQK